MIQYWSLIKNHKEVLCRVDIKRLTTSILDGGAGISFLGKSSTRSYAQGGWKYNFNVKVKPPFRALNNCLNYSPVDYSNIVLR